MQKKMIAASRFLALGVAFGALGVLAVPGESLAGPTTSLSPALDTEDVVYLKDGRELRGRIKQEERTHIVFEVIDRDLGLATEIRIFRDQIYKIERDVAVEDTGDTGGSDAGAMENTNTSDSASEESFDPSIPSIYVVPLEGQIGTDIHPDVYEPVIEEILATQPTCVVFRIDCDTAKYQDLFGEHFFEDLRTLVTSFRNRLRGIRQVVWVKNSVGWGSVLALAWDDIYMMPEARLDGLVKIHETTAGWQDDDVRAKMQAAWSGIVRGFIEFGGHDLAVGEAMMFPEHQLSAVFKGRTVEWSLDGEGEVVADQSTEWTAGFNAEDARNLLISEDTVEAIGRDGLDDMAFILGYREYRKVDGMAEEYHQEYRTEWRAAYENAQKRFEDFRTAQGGNDTRSLAEARDAIQDVLKYMKRYPAVERIMKARHGIEMYMIEVWLKDLQERARQIREQERERDRRDGGGGGRGPGIPGGGG